MWVHHVRSAPPLAKPVLAAVSMNALPALAMILFLAQLARTQITTKQ